MPVGGAPIAGAGDAQRPCMELHLLSTKLSPTAKRTAVIISVAAGVLFLYAVRDILAPFVVATALAYLLNPVVESMARLPRLSRTGAVAVLYLLLIALLIVLGLLVVPALVGQVRDININLDEVVEHIRRLLRDYQVIEVFGFTVDIASFADEVRSSLQDVISFLAARSGGLLVGVVSEMALLLFTLLVSFYLLRDAPAIHAYLRGQLPADYQDDFMALSDQINAVLSDYLRGQLLLAGAVGSVTFVTLSILGVPYALLLGVLAGLLEVVPNLGPILAALPAIALAFLQGSTHFALPNHWFALVVVAAYVVIQQLENNILVPNIIGKSVNLHPVVIMFGVLAGASLAGILGMLLAVPVIAVTRIVGGYVYQKVVRA